MEAKNPVTTNLLAIASHHDDIEIMAMDGILKAYGSKKYAFYGCVVGDGSTCNKSGKYAELNDKDMMEVRNQEQIRASEIGEYSKLYLLKHTPNEIVDAENKSIIKDIKKIIEEVKPDVIYTHNVFDKNPSHRALTLKVIDAIMDMPEELRPRLLYGCEVFRGLDWLPDRYKVTFDLSENKELQNRLIGVYDSRAEGFKDYTKAVMGRKLSNATLEYNAASETEDKLIWYGINLTSVIQKNIPIKEFCVKVLGDFNKELLDGLEISE